MRVSTNSVSRDINTHEINADRVEKRKYGLIDLNPRSSYGVASVLSNFRFPFSSNLFS